MVHTETKKAREDAGLTQFELGQKVGIDPARLSKIERGQGTPTLEQAVAIQRVLGIPVEAWVVASANANQPAAAAGAR